MHKGILYELLEIKIKIPRNQKYTNPCPVLVIIKVLATIRLLRDKRGPLQAVHFAFQKGEKFGTC